MSASYIFKKRPETMALSKRISALERCFEGSVICFCEAPLLPLGCLRSFASEPGCFRCFPSVAPVTTSLWLRHCTMKISFIALLLFVGSASTRLETTDSINLFKEIDVGQKAFTGSRQKIRIWPLGLLRFSGKDTSQSSWARMMIDRLIRLLPLRTSKYERVAKIPDTPSIIGKEEEAITKPKIIENLVPRRRVRIELEKSLLDSNSKISDPTTNLNSYLSELEKITSISPKPPSLGFGNGLESRLMKRLSQMQDYEGAEKDVMRVLVREANSQGIEDPVTVNRMIVLSIIGRFVPLQLVWLSDGLRKARESVGIPRQIVLPGTKEPIEVDRIIEHIIMLGKTIGEHLSRGFYAIENAKVNVEKEIMRFPPEQIALISAISQNPEMKSEVPLSKTAFDIAIARMSMTNADSKLRSILKVGKQEGLEEENYNLLIRHLNEIEDLLKEHEELTKISKNGLPVITWLGDNEIKGSRGKLNQEIYNVVNQVLQQTGKNPIRMLKADDLKTPQYST
ncbi:uncharacterized protein MELLADRAFT_101538 [Melampsora larici-populina 98AG31]|uniref:Uncharacterized protein n=1 Tax=Melampsora larici-populina (strain 98AG31 / pathotype 3-4-7) TaxID=747676 RepID=F4R661_MELLP|nr:uncharacterized protein MELLADRAFT_101538 [Melampsora larici-populina 98AG31]EGG12525.1 hypothetical protein MELLADRAFT_101538 [Melampsora larici-populina 98AG31]